MIFIPSVTLTFFSNISNESSPGLRQALGGKPFSQAADPGPPRPLPTGPAGSHQGAPSLPSCLLRRPETEPTPHWPAQDQSQGSLARPALIGQGRTWRCSEDGIRSTQSAWRQGVPPEKSRGFIGEGGLVPRGTRPQLPPQEGPLPNSLLHLISPCVFSAKDGLHLI